MGGAWKVSGVLATVCSTLDLGTPDPVTCYCFALNSAHISAGHTFCLLSPHVELMFGLPASDIGCLHSFRGQDTAVWELLSQMLQTSNT